MKRYNRIMTKTISKILEDPYYSLGTFLLKRCPEVMSDKWYLKVLWKRCMGYELDLEDPKTFNEKLQWLKLYNRNPQYTMLVDKYRVKKWIEDKIGNQYVIPTLAVYNSVEEIDLDKLPNKFVLKCNHDSGSVVICKDKATFDLKAAKRKLADSLKINYYLVSREWPYKNVKRCVFAEKYMEDDSGGLIDYKVSCFNGDPYKVMVCLDRFIKGPTKYYSFDKNWNLLRHNKMGKEAPESFSLPKPLNLDEMFRISAVLSKDIPFVRVDFYESNGCLYFGEMTFFPDAGFDGAILKEIDELYGSMIVLQ